MGFEVLVEQPLRPTGLVAEQSVDTQLVTEILATCQRISLCWFGATVVAVTVCSDEDLVTVTGRLFLDDHAVLAHSREAVQALVTVSVIAFGSVVGERAAASTLGHTGVVSGAGNVCLGNRTLAVGKKLAHRMAWACDRCGTLHTQNPSECRNCGHQIFEPIGDTELRRHSESTTQPEAIDDSAVKTMGTSVEPDYDSSPDVAVDGSIADEEGNGGESTVSAQESSSGVLRSAYYAVRGTLLAPVGLLRRYFIPLLAFALVFGVVLYLVV